MLLVLAEGRTNREIAERLFISERTVAVHVRRILAKLGVGGRVEAAGVAIRLGLVPGRSRVMRGSRRSTIRALTTLTPRERASHGFAPIGQNWGMQIHTLAHSPRCTLPIGAFS